MSATSTIGQQRTRPNFERQSSQYLCLYDYPSLFCAQTDCSLDLEIENCFDSNIYARIYAMLGGSIVVFINCDEVCVVVLSVCVCVCLFLFVDLLSF